MAETSWPFDAAPTYEDAWRAMARLWQASGVVGTQRGPTDTALRPSLGSGLSFVTQPGAAWLVGHMYNSTAAETTTASTNGNTNPRIDVLVLRMDVTANTITRVIVQGTPAASPTAPAISAGPTVWDLPLASATCPGSGSAQNYNTLKDFRRYAGATVAVSYDTAGYVDQDLRRGDLWLLLQQAYLTFVDSAGTLRGVTNHRLYSANGASVGPTSANTSIASVTVDAPFPYRLVCHGQVDIGSSSGTRSDIVCRLDDVNSGTVVSRYGLGKEGTGHQATCIPRGDAGPFTGSHTVHLVAFRAYGGGTYSTDGANSGLEVEVVPAV